MEVVLLDTPDGDVIARGSYHGGPDYEFVAEANGPVRFRVVGDSATVWAGPDAGTFRQITSAWNRYCAEVVKLPTEAAKLARVMDLRLELENLGALPDDLPRDSEPLWSLLVGEAEHGLG